MIIVEGWLKLAPGQIDEIMEAGRAMIAATRAEDGCLHYSYAQDFSDPDVIRISERWVDEAALTAHFGTPHMAALNEALANVERLGGDVRQYISEEVRRLI